MRPTKNQFFCPECGRTKMRFETEAKALNFISFNGEEVRNESGKTLTRAYYCNTCLCWHLTSSERPAYYRPSVVDRMINTQHRNTLFQIEGLVRQAERLIQENKFSIARDKCYQAIQKAETCVEAVRHWHEWALLSSRLEACVDSCKKEPVKKMEVTELRTLLVGNIETCIAEATELINQGEFEKAVPVLNHAADDASRLKCECKEPLLRKMYRVQIKSLKKLVNRGIKPEEVTKELKLFNQFEQLEKATEKITDNSRYEFVLSIKTKILNVIEKLEQFGHSIEQKNEIIASMDGHLLHSGIARVSDLLQLFRTLISQGLRSSARYYFELSVEVLTSIADIEGEQLTKMKLLQELESAQYTLNSVA